MRCPICSKKVRNNDALQVHYLEDCSGIQRTAEDSRDDQEGENLVEVNFKWVNTKDTFEKNISLVSSLAGQVVLVRNPDGEVYESPKLFVPCGIHCCQLVIGDDCHAVFDMDIDTSQESLYVIIQSDVETSGNEDSTAASNVVDGLESESRREQSSRQLDTETFGSDYRLEPAARTGEFKESSHRLGGVKQNHQVDPEYAREVLRRISREDSSDKDGSKEDREDWTNEEDSRYRALRSRENSKNGESFRSEEDSRYRADSRNSSHRPDSRRDLRNRKDSRESSATENDYHSGNLPTFLPANQSPNESEATPVKSPLTRIASNDFHQVQIHSPGGNARQQNNNGSSDSAMRKGREDDEVVTPEPTEKDQSDLRRRYLPEADAPVGNGGGDGRSVGEGGDDLHIGQQQNSGGGRSRRLDKYIGSYSRMTSGGTLSDQLELEKSIASNGKKAERKKLRGDGDDSDGDEVRGGGDGGGIGRDVNLGRHNDVSRDFDKGRVEVKKPSWGFDEGLSELDDLQENSDRYRDDHVMERRQYEGSKFRSSKSEPYDREIQEDRIFELQAKCDSFQSEMARLRAENDDLIKQLLQMQQDTEVAERKQADRVKETLHVLKQQNKELREENESLKTAHSLQVGDLSRINDALIEEVNDLTSKVDKLKFSNRSFRSDTDARKVSELETEIRSLRLENSDLQSKLSRIRNEFTASQTSASDTTNNHDYDYSRYSSSQNTTKYRASNQPREQTRDLSYYTRDSSTGGLYDDDITYHEPIIKSPSYRSRTSPRDYDDAGVHRSDEYDKRQQRSPRHDYKIDSNYNCLPNHNLNMSRYKPGSDSNAGGRASRKWGPHENDEEKSRTPSVQHGSSRLSKSESYEPTRSSTNDAREHVDIDSILATNATATVNRREKKAKRDRPHSFHGGITNAAYYDSSSPSVTEPLHSSDRYSYERQKDVQSPSSTADKSATCFYPKSPREISVGMRALVTRTSGRLGKGIVKWKGSLPGHTECFLGIELENANGKHDGVYEGQKRPWYIFKVLESCHGLGSSKVASMLLSKVAERLMMEKLLVTLFFMGLSTKSRLPSMVFKYLSFEIAAFEFKRPACYNCFNMNRGWIYMLPLFVALFVAAANAAFRTCDRTYKGVGCYAGFADTLTEVLVNYRVGHPVVDWNDYPGSLHSLACDCVEKAKEKKWKYIGFNWYGRCMGGASFDPEKTAKAYDCIGTSYQPCKKSDTECSGVEKSTFVFEIEEPATPGICSKKLDIGIALDSSSSLYQSDWNDVKAFVSSFIDSTLIGESNVKISVMSFSTAAQIEVKFNDYSNAGELKHKVQNLAYRGGFTRTDLALSLAKDTMFTAGNGARSDAKKIFLILTDGETLGSDATVNWAASISDPAKNLKDSGVEIFGGAIGFDASITELQTISSSPSSDHILVLKDFSTLKGSGKRLSAMTCGDKFENVALKHPTAQSSTHSQWFGKSANAVDGNPNNNYDYASCTRTTNEPGPWWRVDLQAEKEVFEVKVVNRGDCCGSRLNGFEIRIGNAITNNGNDNPICGQNLPISTGETKTFVCQQPMKGRYVNIGLPGSEAKTLTLCEVYVIARG
eukprot:gene591-1251_t